MVSPSPWMRTVRSLPGNSLPWLLFGRQIAQVMDPNVNASPLPDRTARERIAQDLDTNLLVEAGAGSGKTTALVGRMIALIATGSATVDQIAAVTFTRKAAGELRERFQSGIELLIRNEREADYSDDVMLDRLVHALDDIDRAFVGTIHSFCGSLLRERPLEAGLDPGFEELPVEERSLLRRRFWESYLERLSRDSDPILEDVVRAGMRATALSGLFDHMVENPDVDFPADLVGPPSTEDIGVIRMDLEEIVGWGWELMGEAPPPGKDWDSLQRKIRKLHFERSITGWTEPADVLEAMAMLCKPGPRGHTVTLNRWRRKDMAKALRERVNAFGVGDTPANRLVSRWYAHRYALAVRLGRHAVEAFSAHRLRAGKLDFQDLLVLASRLLREDAEVRRQLGERYRRLLVDEFQDTDPLQAEIMLLLSSLPAEQGEEESGQPRAEGAACDPDWRRAVPRPGALFVVGDPKQSIYRFRRADIQLYGFVKERFREFGGVVTLSTNFRSRPAIGDLVNDVFAQPHFFPEKPTAEQAAFERLDTRPPTATVASEGVFTYDISPDQSNKRAAAADDGARISTWIRDRVDSGERVSNDFLILTRGRGQLALYARALESHGLPVEVTGAGVGVEEEIRELEILLECMIDPTNPVKVVAVLVGLFFGIDYDRLVTHRLQGGVLDAMHPVGGGHPDVRGALKTLHAWWRVSVSEPADIFVVRLVGELGLLPYAASGELGSLRAGALVYALDAVRSAASVGDTSLPGALTALRAALGLKEAEAPLEPGRPDAIRLMNLHQAKGLEGTVVVLADPTETRHRRPELHLTRSNSGLGEGFMRVTSAAVGRRVIQDLARPEGWETKEAAERRFTDAEEVRLLYVAATRACEELVVARWPGGRGTSAWSAFDTWLDEHAGRLVLEARTPVGQNDLELLPGAVESEIVTASTALAAAGVPTYEHVPVTALTKSEVAHMVEQPSPRIDATAQRSDYRGLSWGSAVHGALAVAAAKPSNEGLRLACRELLVEFERPTDDHGEPIELGELIALVRAVLASTLWARAQASERFLVEVPFSAPGVPESVEAVASHVEPSEQPRPGQRQPDLFAESSTAEQPPGRLVGEAEASEREVHTESQLRILEGVVDLAFREADGWVIADYKTDLGTDPDFPTRVVAYRRQVELYAEAWTRLTGEHVKERVLFYTARDRIESW